MITWTGLLQGFVLAVCFFGGMVYLQWPRHEDGSMWSSEEVDRWLERFNLPGFEYYDVLAFTVFVCMVLSIAIMRS